MATTDPFDRHPDEYDRWFEEHTEVFEAEIRALDMLLPQSRARGLEVGVGSGQFASRLGVTAGVEPSEVMARRASQRGIEVCAGVAEDLPFADERFDYLLMVTTICFVDDPLRTFEEAFRVLRPGGSMVVGLVDRDSELGRSCVARKNTSVFYRDAAFHSTEEIRELLYRVGFERLKQKQTLFQGEEPSIIRDGYGSGSFVAIRGDKPT